MAVLPDRRMLPRPLLPRLDSHAPDGQPRYGFHSLRATSHTEHPPTPRPPNPRRARRLGYLVATLVGLALALVAAIVGFDMDRTHVEARVVSGTPAKKLSRSGKVQRWKQASLTVQVDERIAQLGPGALAAVERAFRSWSACGTPEITFQLGSALSAPMEPDGVNAIVVAPITAPGHQMDLAVTVGFSDTETGEIVEADIIINPAYPIEPLTAQAPSAVETAENPGDGENRQERLDESVTNPQRDTRGLMGPSCNGNVHRGQTCGERYDLESIVAHEAGHFFGLGEDQEDGLATMYFCTSTCETHKRSLEAPDQDTMREVYAGAFSDRGEVQCSTGPVGARRSASWLTIAMMLLGITRAARASSRRGEKSDKRRR